MSVRLDVLPDPQAAAQAAACELAQAIETARAQRGRAHLALSGGSTPGRTYELLAATLTSFDAVELWFADERCVEPQHEQSNYRLVAETLLAASAIPPRQVHRMPGELGPQLGARRYEQALRRRFAQLPPALDVVLLGIGPDAHVASLFPRASALSAGERAICVAVSDAPKPPPQRISLSLATLRAARHTLLLATGAAKAQAVAAALGPPSADAPASLLRRERLHLLLDQQAAGLLPAAGR